ncbi:MAG: zinc-dependent peptidase [Saprospiraceae bacterium]
MRISSLSIILAIPFLLSLAILLPLSFSYEYKHLMGWIILPIMMLTFLYTFRPQIDYWWIQRKKIGLDKPLVNWLEENSEFYKKLSVEEKLIFEQRAGLFLDSKDFSLKAVEDHKIPEQYKLLSAHEALRITWHHEDFLFKNYDRIILYPHAFPTPDHKYLHPYEVHQTDGIILISKPHLINGFINTLQFFNIGLYVWITAHMKDTKHGGYPMINATEISALDPILPYSTDKIRELVGERLLITQAIYAYSFFENRVQFDINFPKYSIAFKKIFEPH